MHICRAPKEAGQQTHVLVIDLRRVRAGERAGLAAAIERPTGANAVRRAAGLTSVSDIGAYSSRRPGRNSSPPKASRRPEFLAIVEAAARPALKASGGLGPRKRVRDRRTCGTGWRTGLRRFPDANLMKRRTSSFRPSLRSIS